MKAFPKYGIKKCATNIFNMTLLRDLERENKTCLELISAPAFSNILIMFT